MAGSLSERTREWSCRLILAKLTSNNQRILKTMKTKRLIRRVNPLMKMSLSRS